MKVNKLLNCVFLFLVSVACSSTQQSQTNQENLHFVWQNDRTMIAPDCSFLATIDYLPQEGDYECGIFRLGITPQKTYAVDSIFDTNKLGISNYFYGTVSVQGSMHNHWYVFAYSEQTGDGMFVFNSSDYGLTFPSDYEPETLANQHIKMKSVTSHCRGYGSHTKAKY